MVCKNCGKELAEGTKFCTSCGTPCEEATPQAAAPQTAAPQATAAAEGTKEASEAVTPAAEAPKEAEAPKAEAPKDAVAANGDKPQTTGNDNMKKLVCIGGIAVAAFVLLIVLCSLMFGSSPKEAFKAYIKGQFSCDYKAVWNNSIHAKKAQKGLDLYDKDDYKDDYEEWKDDYEDLKEEWKDDGIKYKVSIDIKKVEKIKKSDKEFKWAKEFMEDYYYGCDADKIKQFAVVEARVKATYYEDGERDKDYDLDSGRTQYLMVKIGGNWYMTDFSRSDIKEYLKNNYK